jgi:hypothetical protein
MDIGFLSNIPFDEFADVVERYVSEHSFSSVYGSEISLITKRKGSDVQAVQIIHPPSPDSVIDFVYTAPEEIQGEDWYTVIAICYDDNKYSGIYCKLNSMIMEHWPNISQANQQEKEAERPETASSERFFGQAAKGSKPKSIEQSLSGWEAADGEIEEQPPNLRKRKRPQRMQEDTAIKVARAKHYHLIENKTKGVACSLARVHLQTYNNWKDHPEVLRLFEKIKQDQSLLED